ncbi:MAG TPA: protein-export chaperone SecB [Magnetospirillaceae bacterium]|jgi:preprotein translocase subunit SecB
MSDAAAGPAQTFQVNAQYIKDLSFEAPGTPQIFAALAQGQPEVTVSVNLDSESLGGPIHEVTLRLQIESKLQDKTAFILDLTYCGIFTVQMPEEHVQPLLLIECPRLLFPFARNIIADTVRDGGFPAIMLQPIDFVSLFRQRMEQAAAQQPERPS